ncbi:MAG: hypothetical protein BWY78_00952 [Alphaproteobacteria bacterium ADurb.Bin438]|nr:MAG: hypothetical protein BWY78_00952 [Alphaproteobacteria bacterium ADurb.Bin438]
MLNKKVMVNNIITLIINILIIESAVFTVCFINNSRKIIAFSCFIVSFASLLIHTNLEIFALILIIVFVPIIFNYFMIGNMVKNKEEVFLNKKTSLYIFIITLIFSVIISFIFPINKNLVIESINLQKFATIMYNEQKNLVISAIFLIFSSIIAVTTLLYKHEEDKSKKNDF